jgi:hypothetical protein
MIVLRGRVWTGGPDPGTLVESGSHQFDGASAAANVPRVIPGIHEADTAAYRPGRAGGYARVVDGSYATADDAAVIARSHISEAPPHRPAVPECYRRGDVGAAIDCALTGATVARHFATPSGHRKLRRTPVHLHAYLPLLSVAKRNE